MSECVRGVSAYVHTNMAAGRRSATWLAGLFRYNSIRSVLVLIVGTDTLQDDIEGVAEHTLDAESRAIIPVLFRRELDAYWHWVECVRLVLVLSFVSQIERVLDG